MRAASAIAAVVGFFLAVFCFFGLSGESLPYQDPTPVMLAAQADAIRAWQFGLVSGVVLGVAGVIAYARGKTNRSAR